MALAYAPWCGDPITVDHENLVKGYSASPTMLGRGHTLLDPAGPPWVRHASALSARWKRLMPSGCIEPRVLGLSSAARGWRVGWFVRDDEHISQHSARREGGMYLCFVESRVDSRVTQGDSHFLHIRCSRSTIARVQASSACLSISSPRYFSLRALCTAKLTPFAGDTGTAGHPDAQGKEGGCAAAWTRECRCLAARSRCATRRLAQRRGPRGRGLAGGWHRIRACARRLAAGRVAAGQDALWWDRGNQRGGLIAGGSGDGRRG
jgi:hypothetical protein